MRPLLGLALKLALIALALAVWLAFLQLINVQRAAFDELQGTILFTGEAAAFVCLMCIPELRKRGRAHFVTALLWLSAVPLLLAVAYVQLPASRISRFERRVEETAERAKSYRARNHGECCAPLEAELQARQLELAAARVRAKDVYAFRSYFEAEVTAFGALAALTCSVVWFFRARMRPGSGVSVGQP